MRKQFIDWWRAVLYWNCPSVTNSELLSVQNPIVNNLSGHKEIFGSLTSRKLDIKARWHWKPIIKLTKYCILITKLVFELNISVALHTKFHRFLELPKGSFRKLPLGSSRNLLNLVESWFLVTNQAILLLMISKCMIFLGMVTLIWINKILHFEKKAGF